MAEARESAVSDQTDASDASLGELLHRTVLLVPRLLRDELRAAQAELTGKLKAAGLGAGLIVGAAVFAFFALGVLVATAVLGLANALAPWLSALVVGVVLLVIAGALALVGLRSLKRGVPPAPTETAESVKADLRAVKGTGE